MRRSLGWAIKLAGVYLLFLVAYFAFALGSMKNDTLARYEQRINPSTFIFWQGEELYSNPPLFSSLMSDTKGQLSSRKPTSLADVDIWVLLLDGFDDIKNVEFASQLGLDVGKISRSQPGSSTFLKSAGLSFRLHPIPLIVNRNSVLVLDAKYLYENYRHECLDEMIYGAMIGQRDQALWKRCRTT
ncbi:hypothetical protein [Phaeobacter piscinae]|uniref:hypothetical protein n=1 Tax=Phaeobacter piscinae TaxID=1580596 RepID=UPI00103B94B6|nr:hypothetical protein [Phaeobacter piscinae]UTS81464.1 hypothetical protein OL67_002550 [Phaeobacter piscinae]